VSGKVPAREQHSIRFDKIAIQMNFIELDRENLAQVEAYVRCHNATYRNLQMGAEEFLAGCGYFGPEHSQSYWLAYQGSELRGAAGVYDTHWAYSPGRVQVDWNALDPSDSAEIFEFARDQAAARNSTELQSWTIDNTPHRTELLEAQGFEKIQACPSSRLDTDEFDFERWLPKVEEVRAKGIEVGSIAHFDSQGFDWMPLLFEAMKEVRADIPGPDQATDGTFEQFRAMFDNALLRPKNMMFLAVHDGNIVGYSRLQPSLVQDDLALTGLSGTIRSHRRMGIVTALKVLGIRASRDAGRRYIITDNDETNPMLSLNLALGYRVFETHSIYRKFLNLV
jgi:hypothetical protein